MAVTQLSITTTSESDSLAPVRQLMCTAAATLGLPGLSSTVELLTTEVLANAIRNQAGAVQLTVFRLPGHTLRVEVHDNGAGWPQKLSPHPLAEDGGRGLLIVDTLASSWGATSTDADGTMVWFEIDPTTALDRSPAPV